MSVICAPAFLAAPGIGYLRAMLRRSPAAAIAAAMLVSLPAARISAQWDFGMRGGIREAEALVDRFDTDRSGSLDDRERKAARDYLRSRAPAWGTSVPASRVPTSRSDLDGDLRASAAAAAPAGRDLYDESTLRTIFLRFRSGDWFEELGDFYGSDVEVPADLVVDGELVESVGVRFRGNSSYRMIGDSLKKSFNVSVDHLDPEQRLHGYRTLNLLNANADASMVREVLFSHIAREYIPAPKANFVKLVVNGEDWGVYVNVQQFNRDFMRERYGTGDLARWKVPAGRSSGGSLAWLGPNASDYQRSFELQSDEDPDEWRALARLTEVLNHGAGDAWEAALDAVLDVDGTLWAIALENVFIDGDGYLSRASDYLLSRDPGGRFHVIPYDNNETFRFAGGGGPNSWPTRDSMPSPVAFEGSSSRPLVSRLLESPALRARYLAHVATIVDEWLDWDRIGPLAASYHALIDAGMKADTKSLYGYQAFLSSLDGSAAKGSGDEGDSGWRGGFGGGAGGPSLREFVTRRRDFLRRHPELLREQAELRDVSLPGRPVAGEPVTVTARAASGAERVDSVLLHFSPAPFAPFVAVPMADDGLHGDGAARDGLYGASIPAAAGGISVRYYVEARSLRTLGSTRFFPARAEGGALAFTVPLRRAPTTDVVINELMASNSRTVRDPQRGYDDWIELANSSRSAVDVGGMYLSDSEEDPRRWRIPAGTVIPAGGYLLIWADGETAAAPGLHASFKLSAEGETVMLLDTDGRGNLVLDEVRFGPQEKDEALGRSPDGSGAFAPVRATPGRANPTR
jgi:hypothetical protein